MSRLDIQMLKDFQQRLEGKEISSAVGISKAIKDRISFIGLPSYFFGDREAETVVINLNPGEDATLCDNAWGERTKGFGTSVEGFVDSYLERQRKYGDKYGVTKKGKADSFDVKLAAFLAPWEGSGIGLQSDPDWDNEPCRMEAKTKVINNKLQLELVPYASAKFDLDPKGDVKLLFPYIETLLDEICAKDRTYVIFASSKFEYLFKQYNKITRTDTFTFGELYNPEPSLKQMHDGTEGKLRVKCRVIWIHYQGKKQQALIAHTFPSQGLGRAYDLMQTYGKLCYEQWCHHVK